MREQLTDTEVIKLLQQPDERQHNRALAFLYRAYGPAVIQFIRRQGGTPEEGEDMLGEAIMGFYRNVRANTYQPRASLSTYLTTLAKYNWAKQWRKDHRWRSSTLSLDDTRLTEPLPAEADTSEWHDLLAELMARLDQRCQLLLKAFIDGFTMQEIAIRLDFTNADNAKAHKYRCMQKLKDLHAKQV